MRILTIHAPDPVGDVDGGLPCYPQVGQMSSLRSLSFANAFNLTGTIPTELGDLSRLKSLEFLGTHFQYWFSDAFFSRYLSLDGSIP